MFDLRITLEKRRLRGKTPLDAFESTNGREVAELREMIMNSSQVLAGRTMPANSVCFHNKFSAETNQCRALDSQCVWQFKFNLVNRKSLMTFPFIRR